MLSPENIAVETGSHPPKEIEQVPKTIPADRTTIIILQLHQNLCVANQFYLLTIYGWGTLHSYYLEFIV